MRQARQLSLALLLVSVAILAPIAHAQQILIADRYTYMDHEGVGVLEIGGPPGALEFTITQNGRTFRGPGTRSDPRSDTTDLSFSVQELFNNQPGGPSIFFSGTIHHIGYTAAGGGSYSGGWWQVLRM